mgnify:CR=1 FL=1
MFVRVLFLIISLLLLSACVSKNTSSTNLTTIETEKEHKIKSEELRLLMRELNMVVYDRQKSELDRDDIRRRYALNLSDVVKELSYKIEHIPQDGLGENLTQKDRELYAHYANRLYKNGEEIYDVAQKYELEKLDNKIENMQRTCDGCHALFRD